MVSLAELRHHALGIFQAGLAAADPYRAVKHCLKMDGDKLTLTTTRGELIQHSGKVHLIAVGKAACDMMQAACVVIPASQLASTPLAITNEDNVRAIVGVEVIGAGHPLPNRVGLLAAQRLVVQLKHTLADELVLVLISGGGSALLPLPAATLSLSEKIATTDLLLASGATINEINCVRKHLSQLKGGQLAVLAQPAKVHTLILSDVIGDDLSSIASGLTVADASTYAEAIAILQRYHLWQRVPTTVQTHLHAGARGQIAETPKADHPVWQQTHSTLLGSNQQSLAAMQRAAAYLGYDTHIYSHQLCGEAQQVAAQWVRNIPHSEKPLALLAGGETTVTLTDTTGLGGRNQELALAFAVAAEHTRFAEIWALLSGGTDGRDGPTDAAGGLVDSTTISRLNAQQHDARAFLAQHDSYHALEHSGDLLRTGATGTNVADVQILLVAPCVKQ